MSELDKKLAETKTITLKAKGLWLYLRTRPAGFQFSIDRITQDTKDGRDAVRGAVQELEIIGALIRETKSTGRNFQTTWKMAGGEE